MNVIEQELNQLVDAGLPAASVYIEDADGQSLFFTAGYADCATQQPMTPDMYYRVGSTTKTFTAVVILQLVAEGELALDDTLQELLPEESIPLADALTVEHLLRMRSGLFDFEDDFSLKGNFEAHLRPYSLQHVLELALQHPAEFPPNSQFAYCNTNFCLLELLVERITGNTLGEELTNRIIEPLSLGDTRYPDEDDLSLPEPYIRGYTQTASDWTECSHVFFGRGDGALISTAHDMARFFHALLTERVLLPENFLDRMMQIVSDDPPAEMAYGMGLIKESLPGGEVWGHSGRGYGYHHFPFLHVESGRFVVCILNGTYGFKEAKLNDEPHPSFTPEFRNKVYDLPLDEGA